MYIQITDKCNMRCEHCCFSCTKKGSFMSMETFDKALKLAEDYDSMLAIGGGEPTLHPQFEAMLCKAMGATLDGKVFIVTNGSIKERAMLIYNLAQQDIIQGKLSYDQFHDMNMVDEDVIEAFRNINSLWGSFNRFNEPHRETSMLASRGRAKQFECQDKCACEDTFIDPQGRIFQCGCKTKLIGNVDDGITVDDVEWNECSNLSVRV